MTHSTSLRLPTMGALLILISAASYACSDDPASTQPPVGDEVVIVDLRSNLTFSRPSLSIEVGTTVRWVNTTNVFHTVTPEGHDQWSEWQTSVAGQSFEVRFDQVGAFDYFCVPHRGAGMVGTITVR